MSSPPSEPARWSTVTSTSRTLVRRFLPFCIGLLRRVRVLLPWLGGTGALGEEITGEYWKALRAQVDDSVRDLGSARAVAGRYAVRVSPELLARMEREGWRRELLDYLTERVSEHVRACRYDFLGRPLLVRIEAAEEGSPETIRVEWCYDPPARFAYLCVREGPETGRAVLVDHTPYRVGRGRSQCDLVISGQHTGVSREHGEVVAAGEGFAWRSLGKNGSWMEGKPIPLESLQALSDGDRIRLGGAEAGVELEFRLRGGRKRRNAGGTHQNESRSSG